MKKSKGEIIKALCAAVGLAVAAHAGICVAQPWSGGELPLIEPSPTNGTFFLISRYGTNGFGRKFDSNPFAFFGAPVYGLGSNYLVDDSGVDFAEVHQLVRTNPASRPELLGLYMVHSLRAIQAGLATNGGGEEMELMSGGEYSMESEGEGEGFGPMELTYTSSSNELYLQVTDISKFTNGFIGVSLINTIPDLAYDLMFRTNLSSAADEWLVDQQVIGAENTNSTFTWVSMEGRTSALYLRARSYDDADGDGLPSWWEMKYGLDSNSPDTGNTGIPDGYKDLAGDGSTALWKYENGKDPRQAVLFPPKNVHAVLDASGSNVVVTWESSGGTVTGYGVERGDNPDGLYFSEIRSNSATTFTFTNHLGHSVIMGFFSPPSYIVRAYSGTNYADGQVVSPVRWDLEGDSVFVIRGSQADTYLMVQSAAADLGRIVLFEWPSASPITAYASNLVNGAMKSPVSEGNTELYGSYRLYSTNGDAGHPGYTDYESDRDHVFYPTIATAYRFVDARRHMKENLKFLVRAATVNHAYSFTADQNTLGGSGWDPFVEEEANPEYYFARPETSTNYEYSGFHIYDPSHGYSMVQELRPIYDNYLLHNLAFEEPLLGQTGADSFDYCSGEITRQIWGAYYTYVSPGSETNAPLSLIMTNAAFPFVGDTSNPATDCYVLPESGLSVVGTNLTLASGAKNCFGLNIGSVKFSGADGVNTLSQGQTSNFDVMDGGQVFLGTDMPDLQITNYYFASQLPYFTYLTNANYYTPDLPAPPFPGAPSFSPTNAQPLLIAPFGQPFTVAGWAKLQIANGYAGKYAYLEQYWDKAYKVGTNGAATTNQTGLLSPYGEFFPTEPGPMALVTMPDIDTGQRGTGVVNVIKLQLDVNHDGVMDLSFGGPDNTSSERPFVFWVNNDNDGAGVGQEVDVGGPEGIRDHQFNQIRSQRGLEDFARLRICGLPALPFSEGYSVYLSFSAASGNPSINLYQAYETNGGTLYLSDTNVANITVTNRAYSSPLGTVSGSHGFLFPVNFFAGTNSYLLFEGGDVGSGQLTLTIQRGTNVLAQTSAWLDLRDVQDLIEHAYTENLSLHDPPVTNSGSFKLLSSPDSDSAEDKQIILYVHGLNHTEFFFKYECETIFKRLYWQGYHGRFAALRWPAPVWAVFPVLTNQINPFSYNKGEYVAWEAGPVLKSYVDDLHDRFPGYTLNIFTVSEGGVTASEAIRLGAQAENLVFSKVTLPAEAFDGGNTNLIYDYLASGGASAPDADSLGGYNNCLTNGTTRRVNFYNDDDYACFLGPLHLGAWELIQKITRPDNSFQLPGWDYYFDGTNCFFEYTDSDGQPTPLGTRIVTQDYEKKSYVARSRTKAIGAAGLKYPPYAITGGVMTTNISLQDATRGFTGGARFDDTRSDHGGEFNKTIQNSTPFYFHLLKEGFELQPRLSP